MSAWKVAREISAKELVDRRRQPADQPVPIARQVLERAEEQRDQRLRPGGIHLFVGKPDIPAELPENLGMRGLDRVVVDQLLAHLDNRLADDRQIRAAAHPCRPHHRAVEAVAQYMLQHESLGAALGQRLPAPAPGPGRLQRGMNYVIYDVPISRRHI